MNARAASAYKRVDLESAPKHQIVERLFDRFSADIAAARVAIANRDVHTKAAQIDHALRITTELRASLDHTAAPELCANLDALYAFVIDRLVAANLELAVKPLDDAARIMGELGDAFRRAHEQR